MFHEAGTHWVRPGLDPASIGGLALGLAPSLDRKHVSGALVHCSEVFGSGDALEREREADCALYNQLVACGYDPNGSAALLMNKKTLMPLIAQELLQCPQASRH